MLNETPENSERNSHKSFLTRQRIRKAIPLLLLAALLLILVAALYASSWTSYDWWVYPTSLRLLLSGHSPYDNALYHNPPWTLILLLPLALLPTKLGEAFVAVLGLVAYTLIARRFGARPLALVFFLLSPPVLFDLYAGNITWLALLGLLMPPWLGLFFIMSKPHLGIGIAVFWLVEAWKQGGFWQVVRVFAPITSAFLLSWLIFGTWFLKSSWLVDVPFNKSIFPYGILIGVVLFYLSIRRDQLNLAVASSPFFAPYFPLHGWTPLLIGLLPNPWLILAADVILFVVNMNL